MVINSCSPDNKLITEATKQRLVNILDMKTEDTQLLQEAIDILHESGSIKYAEDTANRMLKTAWDELEPNLPEGEAKGKISDLS